MDQNNSKEIKIVIASSIYPPDPGGPATHSKALFDWLNSKGVKTEIVILSAYLKFPIGIRHLLYTLTLFKKSLSCNIIYAHDSLGVGLPAVLVSLILRKKIIIRTGGDVVWERAMDRNIPLNEWYERGYFNKSIYFQISKFVFLKVDKIIVPSLFLKNIYEKYYNVTSQKIYIVANPISATEYKLSVNPKIIFASRLVKYKNLENVFIALKKVFLLHPELKLVIMGDGPEAGKLKHFAKTLEISDKVIFKGVVSQKEVLQETAGCLFTLAPAYTEFNPNYVLQGIFYKKPFIISRNHGLPFVVPEDFLFSPVNVNELADKINFLLTDEGYSRALSFVQNIDFKMSWENNLEENFKVINSLLNG